MIFNPVVVGGGNRSYSLTNHLVVTGAPATAQAGEFVHCRFSGPTAGQEIITISGQVVPYNTGPTWADWTFVMPAEDIRFNI